MVRCFNAVQKQKRAKRKRAIHGDPTKKLKNKSHSLKPKGKLLKKWRKEQKEVIEKGLVTMEDVEMVAAEGTSQDATNNIPHEEEFMN